jgi:hypothetical protein
LQSTNCDARLERRSHIMKPYILLAITFVFVVAASIATGCASSGSYRSSDGYRYDAAVYQPSNWRNNPGFYGGGYYHYRRY